MPVFLFLIRKNYGEWCEVSLEWQNVNTAAAGE